MIGPRRTAVMMGEAARLPAESAPLRARAGARRDSLDAADQQMERSGIVERVSELDPDVLGQEGGQAVHIGIARPGQQHRDDPQLPLTLGHLPRDRRTHLLVMPGPERTLTDDYRTRIAAHQRLLDLRLPGLAGDEVPLVEPGGEPRIEQSPA